MPSERASERARGSSKERRAKWNSSPLFRDNFIPAFLGQLLALCLSFPSAFSFNFARKQRSTLAPARDCERPKPQAEVRVARLCSLEHCSRLPAAHCLLNRARETKALAGASSSPLFSGSAVRQAAASGEAAAAAAADWQYSASWPADKLCSHSIGEARHRRRLRASLWAAARRSSGLDRIQ